MSKKEQERPSIIKREVIFAVLKNNSILLEERNADREDEFFGFVLVPGGGMEDGESFIETVLREIGEEMPGINPTSWKFLGVIDSEEGGGINRRYIYLVDSFDGDIEMYETGDGSLRWEDFGEARKKCEHPITQEILDIIEPSLP